MITVCRYLSADSKSHWGNSSSADGWLHLSFSKIALRNEKKKIIDQMTRHDIARKNLREAVRSESSFPAALMTQNSCNWLVRHSRDIQGMVRHSSILFLLSRLAIDMLNQITQCTPRVVHRHSRSPMEKRKSTRNTCSPSLNKYRRRPTCGDWKMSNQLFPQEIIVCANL